MKDADFKDAVRLIPWKEDNRHHTLELSRGRGRYFVDGAWTDYFWAPYKDADLLDVAWAVTPSRQLILAHPSYHPYKLEQIGGEWGLTAIKFNT